jgi:hypothetical protein
MTEEGPKGEGETTKSGGDVLADSFRFCSSITRARVETGRATPGGVWARSPGREAKTALEAHLAGTRVEKRKRARGKAKSARETPAPPMTRAPDNAFLDNYSIGHLQASGWSDAGSQQTDRCRMAPPHPGVSSFSSPQLRSSRSCSSTTSVIRLVFFGASVC